MWSRPEDEDVSRLYRAAKQAYEEQDFATSLHLLERGLRNHPNSGELWELKGLVHYAREEWQPAVQAIEEASILIPLSPAGHVCLGFSYLKSERATAARDVFGILMKNDRLPTSLVLQVAAGLDELNEPGTAMVACRKLLDRDPELAQPYYDLGYYSARCGLPSSTTEALARKAISLDPGNIGYRVGLSGLLIKQERFEEAHEVIGSLTDDDIHNVACRCCLERIADLFQHVHDYRRNILCRQRLLQLELQGGDSDCD